ncbi:hypothetical protein CEXT_739841 [Caerostris extrusa]|uniref:Uncharacterized protein n=1 Tax=Caerostris extrusa TaxID=172846 RepID=A0AAV4U8L4_CAEEX|nr:hypothetical protein CEXT_739841 [Caerostris extrusa]
MRRGQADVETNLYSLQITSPSSEWNETAFIMDVVRARLSQSVVFLASQTCCKSFLAGERVNGILTRLHGASWMVTLGNFK